MFENTKVLVTGATGLVGSHVVWELLDRGADVRVVVHNRPNPFGDRVEAMQGDLRDPDMCRKAVRGMRCVVHCAAVTGGLLRNTLDPASVFAGNLLMNTQMLDAAREAGVERYLFSSNISVYPNLDGPAREEEAWSGPPHESAVGAAWVRRIGELQATIYAQQYGMPIAITRGGNAYGPHDMFFDIEYSHVVPALIVKAVRKDNPFRVWGNGQAVRDFIYVQDLARGMLLALEKYAVCDPINLGSGTPVKITDLVKLILKLAGHEQAELVLESDKPTGPLYKVPDVSKCRERLGFSPQVTLEEGLRRTINWYLENRDYMKGYRSA